MARKLTSIKRFPSMLSFGLPLSIRCSPFLTSSTLTWFYFHSRLIDDKGKKDQPEPFFEGIELLVPGRIFEIL
jgi:hypothetical protein